MLWNAYVITLLMVKLPQNFSRLWLSIRPSENGITLLGGAFSIHSGSPCCFWIGGKSLLNVHSFCRLFILILELEVAERVSEMFQMNPLQDSSLGSLEPSLTLVFWLPEAPKICWPFIVLVMEESPRKQALCFCGLPWHHLYWSLLKCRFSVRPREVYVNVNLNTEISWCQNLKPKDLFLTLVISGVQTVLIFTHEWEESYFYD